jgi:hypothetical protein
LFFTLLGEQTALVMCSLGAWSLGVAKVVLVLVVLVVVLVKVKSCWSLGDEVLKLAWLSRSEALVEEEIKE